MIITVGAVAVVVAVASAVFLVRLGIQMRSGDRD